MANEIFGTDIAAVVNDAFAGNLHPLTLRKITRATDDYGAPIEGSANYPGEGVRLKWRTETLIAKGWPLDAAKILIMQNGIPAPAKGDEVTILGQAWHILDIEQDPVNATWSVAATLST